MKNNKVKKITLITVIMSFVAVLFLGFGMTLPGLGLQSQKTINSLTKKIDSLIPKNRIWITEDGFSAQGVNITLESSFLNDALSTFNNEQLDSLALNPKNIDDLFTTKKVPLTKNITLDEIVKGSDYNPKSSVQNDVVTLSLEEYNSFISPYLKKWNDQDKSKHFIDMNVVSHAVLNLDLDIAHKYHNYGYTHSGFGWLLHGSPAFLLNPNYKKTAEYADIENQVKNIPDENYIKGMKFNSVNNIMEQPSFLEKSNGQEFINNKVWFINNQLSTIVNTSFVPNIFSEESIKYIKNNIAAPKAIFDLSNNYMNNVENIKSTVLLHSEQLIHPDYNSALELARVGSAILLVVTPIVFILGLVTITVIFIKYRK